MPLILHVGLPKTGSTALQSHLARTKLPADMIYVGAPKYEQDGVHFAGQWLKRIRVLSQTKTVVISYEGLFGVFENDFQVLRQNPEALEELLRLPETDVLMYVRDHHTWLESLCTQSLQQGSVFEPDSWCNNALDNGLFKLTPLVETLAAVIPQGHLIVRGISHLSSCVTDFSELFNVSLEDRHSDERFNVSVHPDLISHMTSAMQGQKAHRQRQIRLAFQYASMQLPSRAGNLFAPETHARISKTYASDWYNLDRLIASALPKSTIRNALLEWQGFGAVEVHSSGLSGTERAEALRIATHFTDCKRCLRQATATIYGHPKRDIHRVSRATKRRFYLRSLRV